MDDLAHIGGGAGVEEGPCAVDVDRAQQVAVPRQRNLGHVVEHDVGALDGPPYRGRVPDVALDHRGPELVGPGHVDVEQPHVVASRHELGDEQPPEVAVAARHHAVHGASNPRSTHQRTLRRMPSSSSISGAYPSSVRAAEMSQAIVLSSSPRTWSGWT